MKRYDLEDTGTPAEPWHMMVECEDGEWVRYDDALGLNKNTPVKTPISAPAHANINPHHMADITPGMSKGISQGDADQSQAKARPGSEAINYE